MASRILAQLLVAGGTTLLRAAGQAWGQALANAQRSGVAAEAVQQATKSGTMLISEAQMILGVKESAPYAEVMKRYKHLFEANEKQGSFYLQSKVYRAWEALDEEYKAKGLKPAEDEQQQQQQQQQEQQQQQQHQKDEQGR